MGPQPSTLLGLVLCLGQMIHTQEGALPKPSLRAEPGPVIPRGRTVTFMCQSPAGAELFRLDKDGSQEVFDQKIVPQDGRQGTQARFLIPAVNEHSAGSYRCLYNQGSRWSERSEPLDLQVTEEDVSTQPPGPMPRPSLVAEPGPVLPRGTAVTLVCRGPAGARLFRLEQDLRTLYDVRKSVSQGGSQGSEGRFHIPAVSHDTAGSYRCLYNQGSNIWSECSEPLDLQVTEEDVSTQPSDPASRNYEVENSISLILAGMVVMILVAILVEAGLSQLGPAGTTGVTTREPLPPERGDPRAPAGSSLSAPRLTLEPRTPRSAPTVFQGQEYQGPHGLGCLASTPPLPRTIERSQPD